MDRHSLRRKVSTCRSCWRHVVVTRQESFHKADDATVRRKTRQLALPLSDS